MTSSSVLKWIVWDVIPLDMTVRIVDTCYKKGIAIRFLENGLSTEGTMGKMVIQILAAVAEAGTEKGFLEQALTMGGRPL